MIFRLEAIAVAVGYALIMAENGLYCETTLLRGRVQLPLDGSVVVVEDYGQPGASDSPEVSIDQRHMVFIPSIIPVVQGTCIEFPNSETAIYHNVILHFPDTGRTVDLGTYGGGDTRRFVVREKGVVEVLCVIHARMYAVIVVTDNPYFSEVDGEGIYEIRDLSPGSYKISCWSVDVKGQKYRKETKHVIVPDEGTVVVDF